jgi:hypothetical protein
MIPTESLALSYDMLLEQEPKRTPAVINTAKLLPAPCCSLQLNELCDVQTVTPHPVFPALALTLLAATPNDKPLTPRLAVSNKEIGGKFPAERLERTGKL